MATGCNSRFDNFRRRCIGELEYSSLASQTALSVGVSICMKS